MNYFERCGAVMDSLDPQEIENCTLDTLIGRSGSAAVYSLGSFATSHGAVEVALKHVASPAVRLFGELRDIAILEERVPEMVDQLPYFIGTLTVKGQDAPIALITEDASKSSSLPVRDMSMTSGTLSLLDKRFADVGGLSVFDVDTLTNHTCFEVDGQQRLLDLAPSIFLPSKFRASGRKEYEAATEKAFEAMASLDKKISAESDLALGFAQL